jgi:D-glycero-D-manno-heptose 1,7-bisphosphate phosphatase
LQTGCTSYSVMNSPPSTASICPPYYPTAGLGEYKQDNMSRKPLQGMLFQAQRELGIDLAASILIGDKLSDVEGGIAAGVGRNLLLQAENGDIPPNSGCVRIGRLHEAQPFFADPRLWRP